MYWFKFKAGKHHLSIYITERRTLCGLPINEHATLVKTLVDGRPIVWPVPTISNICKHCLKHA